jgi:hypothetical protein
MDSRGLSTVYPDGSYQRFPKIHMQEIRFLWIHDYYDYARTGMAVYRGEKCWFAIASEDSIRDDHLFSDFVLVRLRPEQFTELEYRHELFKKYVGDYWDYDEDGTRARKTQNPGLHYHQTGQHHLFYDAMKNREQPDLSGNELIGWYERDWGLASDWGMPEEDDEDE